MSQVSTQSIAQSSNPSVANGQASKISRETLLNYLVQAAKTMRRVELGIGIAGWLCTIVVFLLSVILIDHWLWPLNTFARFAVLSFLIAWSAWWIPNRILPLLFQSIHPEHAARKIESQYPEMKESLISWLQLSTSENTAPKGVLAVVGRFAVRNLGGQDSSNIVDSANLIRVAALLFGFLLTGTVYLFVSPKSGITSLSRMLMPWASIAPAARVRIVNVSPGDTIITQGTNVPIAVTVRGMHQGDRVSLRYDLSDGQQVGQLLKMNEEIEGINYRLDFGKSFGGIHQPLQYWIDAGDATAGPFSLRVQVVPIVAIDRLEYDYPAYTKLKSRSIQQDGTIEAPEGTRVRLFAHANQPMAKSRLEFDPVIDNGLFLGASQILDLETQETQINGSWLLQLDKKKSNPTLSNYRIKATNSLGESNGDPVIYKIKVIGDLAPEVSLQSDLKASVDVEIDGSLDIEMRAVDPDYGLVSLSATGKLISQDVGKGTKPLFSIKCFESKSGRTGQVVEVYSFVPREHNLNVDDRIEFRTIATDNRCQVGTDIPEPNQSSSNPLQIRIVASKNDPNKKPNASEPNANSKEETQGSKAKTPGKANSPDKKTNSQAQNKPNANTQDGKTDSGANEKKDPKDTNKDPSENNDSKSDDQKDSKGPDGKAGGKQSSGGKQEKNNSGGKKGSESNESGSESSEPGDGEEGVGSTGSNSSGSKSKSTKSSMQSPSTDERSSQSEASDVGDEGSEQSSPSGTNSSKAKSSLSKRDPSQASDEDKDLSNPEHDGEKFEVIERMRQEEEKSQQSDDKQSDGKQSDGKQSDGKQSDGKQSDGKQSDGKQSDGKQSDGKQSDGKQSDGKQSDGKQSDGKQSDGKQSDGKQSDGKQSDGKQSDGKQSDGKQSDGKQSDGKQSDGKQSDGKQSDGKQSDGKQSDGKQSDGKQGDGKQGDGKQSDGKQSDGKQSDGKQSDGKQSDGKQSDGKQSDGKQSDGKQSDGKQSDGKQSDGKQSDGKQSDGKQSDGKQSDGKQSDGKQSDGKQSDGKQSDGKQSDGKQSDGKQSDGKQSDGKQSDGKQSDGKQSDGKQSDGKQSDGKQSDGKQSDGKQSDGKQSDGKQSDGKQSDGKQSDGKQSDGKQSDGKQSDGKQSDGKQSDGKQSDGKQSDGKQSDGKQSDGKQSDGKQSDGKQSDGKQSDGKQSDGKQSDGKQSDGKQSDGKQSDGKQSDGKQSDGKQSEGKQSDGKQSDGKQSDGKQSDGKQSDGKQSDGKQSDGKQSDGDGDSKSEAGQPKPGDPSKSKSGSASEGTNKSGNAGSGGSLNDSGDTVSKNQADPTNQDYANKTTDLALDYLKRQKDQPDPELLKRLNWTKDDMQKFIDRWTEAKELAKTDPSKKRELDATLKSLGLRPAKSKERTVEDKDDDLKGLLEEGSRVRPPESLRERFEQFRKAAGKL